MKRFYREVSVTDGVAGCEILLDGKPLRTPAKNPLSLPGAALAEAIAEEWRAQGEDIAPAEMRLTKLANSARDWVIDHHEAVRGDILSYAETDLLCHRAEMPDDLVTRQATAWDPLLDWAEVRYGVRLAVGPGLLPLPQPAAARVAFAAALSEFSPFSITGLHAAVACAGSIVIGLALAERRLSADEAFIAAEIDATYQLEQWGEDADASHRRAGLRADLEAAAAFLSLTGP